MQELGVQIFKRFKQNHLFMIGYLFNVSEMVSHMVQLRVAVLPFFILLSVSDKQKRR